MEPVIESPKSTLNLAGLKAAFSSQHHRSNLGSKSDSSKSATSGPAQKTLQSFFKGSVKPTCSPSLKSPLKPNKDPAQYSPVGQSVLDFGFTHGRMSCGDTDDKKECPDINTAVLDDDCSDLELSSHKPVFDRASVKNETLKETTNNCQPVPEDQKVENQPYTASEDVTVSPNAKRARKEESNTLLRSYEESCSSVVDAPVCLQRRTVPVQFSLNDLTEKMKQLREQQKERASEKLRYRRFRAKINPGENQSAEEELKKEIRQGSEVSSTER